MQDCPQSFLYFCYNEEQKRSILRSFKNMANFRNFHFAVVSEINARVNIDIYKIHMHVRGGGGSSKSVHLLF